MTEEEWLACGDPESMLRALRSYRSDRKGRLFSCAAAAYVGAASPDFPQRRRGIEAVERCAESGEPLEFCTELDVTRAPCIGTLHRNLRFGLPPSVLVGQLVSTSTTICLIEALGLFTEIQSEHPGIVVEFAAETGSLVEYFDGLTRTLRVGESESSRYRDGHVAACLRDIFGNPFRPVTLAPACRTPAVLALARAASDVRKLPSGELDPDRLAVLADALEDAGAAGDILAHLRGPGPHVRGCWALDLALGRE